MSKQHTLFNFFKKVPSPVVNDSKAVKSESPRTTPSKPKPSDEFKLCEIVWAKLEGFPWWPSLICQHPKSKKHIIGKEVHVQFFDQPPTRAWIKQSQIKLYKAGADDDKRNPKSGKLEEREKLKVACKEADAAVEMSEDARADLLVDFSTVPLTPIKNDTSVEDEVSPGTDKENEDSNVPPTKKRKFVFDSDESGDEYKPDKKEDSDEDVSSGVDSAEEEIKTDSEEEESIEETPPARGVKRKRNHSVQSAKKPKPAAVTPKNNSTLKPLFATPSSTTKAKLSLFKNTPSSSASKESQQTASDAWPHLKYEFLQPDKILDKNKRRSDDPEYDHRTLYVPESFKASVTPGVRQWWELKTDHFDCVLFFKVGKFYELYHMDAVIGVNELSLSYMRGEFAHSGFPEIAYGRFSTILVQKGYKVARVEQTETPDMMTERCRLKGKTSKFDKVVNREICQLTTKGTQTFSFLDGEAKESETNYLLALTEQVTNGESVYGVCFVDTSIGLFHLGQFKDDKYSSRLRTLVSHHPPVQVIYERSHLSPRTMQFLKSTLACVQQEPLASGSEFWSANHTLTFLAEGKYFSEEGGACWPDEMKRFISDADSLGLTSSADGDLALKALGATVWYLKRSFLDQQLLTMKKFEVYQPVDVPDFQAEPTETVDLGRYMVLDGITLSNLEVLVNSNGGKEGTLLAKLDRCCTFSGKRLLRQWICSPLCNVDSIRARQAAVAELQDKMDILQEVRTAFKQIPDLERLLGRIHTLGNVTRSKTHPDSRAIFFEDKIYSKRKIQDFLSALSGFEKLDSAMTVLRQDESITSRLLVNCCKSSPKGSFPLLKEHLRFFDEAFDKEQAKTEGCIIPKSSGLDKEYDAALEELSCIEDEVMSYLRGQCQYFGVQVKYFGTDKNRYQLEIPESQVKKAGTGYEFTSSRKGFKRFVTDTTKNLLKRQMHAEEAKAVVLKDLSRRVFAQFSKKQETWNAAVQCMAVLDVLMSLADYQRTEEGETCVPEFDIKSSPYIDVRDGRHPCISVSEGFIPNDTVLGSDRGSLLLLTGPNMGGKSTIMRQLGLISIMAHVGCAVPATSCRLVPVDRIFTRIGAKDDILAGESTFFVELTETSLFLNHASRHALVLVDELGRGTSTYDGTAIAFSVVRELSTRGCRTLFSTHYHTLVDDFKTSTTVSLGHMACMVETDEDDPSEEHVTFLYKLTDGACPKSHGFNAAKLAGVPQNIIKVGREKAAMLEKEGERRKLFKKLFSTRGALKELPKLLDAVSLVL